MAHTMTIMLLGMISGIVPGKDLGKPLTAGEVVDRIREEVTCDWSSETVDTFKAGEPDREVTGIATTFTATYQVLETAAEKGCNLVITHEPTYYNHYDSKEMLEDDPVYRAKQELIDRHGLIVFRFHDHWHRTEPDGIYVGMIEKLQWDSKLAEGQKRVFNMDGTVLDQVTAHMKRIFPEANIRVVGDPQLELDKAAFLAGAPGSRTHIGMLQRPDVNLIVIGEAPEWETIEYVRDASQAGLKKSLIILGHAVSEEAGMAYCAEWLKTFVDEVPVRFIPAGDPFR